jgi:hypothetical protein
VAPLTHLQVGNYWKLELVWEKEVVQYSSVIVERGTPEAAGPDHDVLFLALLDLAWLDNV